jgi:probable biosynthetic protein (TIGR04098 family)
VTSAYLLRPPAFLDESCLTRRVMVTPGMCGGSSLIFSQLGDWTWETVGAVSQINVYDARNAEGQPAYLSFYYFHVRGSESIHPHGLTFGDELDVASRVFDFGSESVLTLHRLSRAGDCTEAGVLDPVEFYERPREDCLYVQNLNRWISRSKKDSNQDLVEGSPVGFRHEHLPRLPSAYSPRGVCSSARKSGTFYPSDPPGYVPAAPLFTTSYALDVVHDLNGVGLLYFASYFSIIDTALLRLWREIGRDDQQFLRRRVLDHQLGYFGNADIDSTFRITVRLLRHTSILGDEIVDVAIRDQDTGRLLAVAGLRVLAEEP